MVSLITFHGNADFVKMLVDADVEFLLVGGLAVVFYKCRNPNDLDDLDLLLNPSPENAERFINVLTSPNLRKLFNLELCCLPSVPQVARANFHIALKFDPMLDIDVFSTPEDVSFSQLFRRSECASLNDNIPIRVISRPDLIEMKRRAVRILSNDKKKHENDLRCLEVV
jgi:hypothetical protein